MYEYEELDAAIRKNRIVTVTLTLVHNGTPVVHQDVLVQQKRHELLFGANWGDITLAWVNGELEGREKELAEMRNAYFLQLFNQVTLPFYWERVEPQRDHYEHQTQRLLNLAQWYKEHGCTIKGHPLCWHTLSPHWLLELDNREILQAQLGRIKREVTRFAGLIDVWDVINEPVIMPLYDRYDNGITRICKALGRINLIRATFDAAREANPKAVLLVNDFDISPAYELLIEECLAAGISIDAIGIQSHMHQGYWGVEKTLNILYRFSRFGLPIHFTEITLVSGHLMPPEIVDLNDYQVNEWPTTPEGEERQALEVILHYKTLVSNPYVQSITWWDFSDGGWLNAPAGLLRRDMSPKPAYEALLKLIKGEWWLSPTQMTTNAKGQLVLSGFPGKYELEIGSRKVPFSLSKNLDALVIHL